MYGNLYIEMKIKKITQDELRKCIGITRQAVVNKLKGKTDFTSSEMFEIRKKFFPNCSLEYLFEKRNK